jgi:integrase
VLVFAFRRGEVLGLIEESIDEAEMLIGPEWQLVVVSGQPMKHKQQLKTDGSTDVLPIPPMCIPVIGIARDNRAKMRTDEWPVRCICGEKHTLLFTTSTGMPIHPGNLRRSFDSRCRRAGVRLIRLQDTRRTTASPLRDLGVHPRVAITMEVYTDVPDPATREALGKLGDWLDQTDEAPDDDAGTPVEDDAGAG